MTTAVIDIMGSAPPSIYTEPSAAAPTDSYSPVRFNALKHGVLSRLVVLPHEDRAECDRLLAALLSEHKPDGRTEQHLAQATRAPGRRRGDQPRAALCGHERDR